MKLIYFNAQFSEDHRKHRDVSGFSKVKYFRGRMRSSTCLEESSPPDATTSHSDFLTVPCCSPFPGNRQVSLRISRQTSTFLRRWREEFRFGFALHITPPNPVSFFIEKPPVETLKVLYSKTSLEEVTWGCSSRTSLPTIIPLRTVNRQRAFTAYS